MNLLINFVNKNSNKSLTTLFYLNFLNDNNNYEKKVEIYQIKASSKDINNQKKVKKQYVDDSFAQMIYPKQNKTIGISQIIFQN